MPEWVKIPSRKTPSVTAPEAATITLSCGSGVSTTTLCSISSARFIPSANTCSADEGAGAASPFFPEPASIVQYIACFPSRGIIAHPSGSSLPTLASSFTGSVQALASATTIFEAASHSPTATSPGERSLPTDNRPPSTATLLPRQSSGEKLRESALCRPSRERVQAPVVRSHPPSIPPSCLTAPPNAQMSWSPANESAICSRSATPAPSAGGTASSVNTVDPKAGSFSTHFMRSARYSDVTSAKSCSHLARPPRTSAAMNVPLSVDPLPNRTNGRSPATTIPLIWLQYNGRLLNRSPLCRTIALPSAV